MGAKRPTGMTESSGLLPVHGVRGGRRLVGLGFVNVHAKEVVGVRLLFPVPAQRHAGIVPSGLARMTPSSDAVAR